MSICKYCGADIEFRYIDGRRVPIHPDGGWHCGSWPPSGASSPAPQSGIREWQESEFTRPTPCPKCGANVFFIRHNGGSVWVNDLGWPWPKHGCFDQSSEPAASFSTWSAKASRLTNPKLGVIIRLRSDVRRAEPWLDIRLADSSEASLTLRWTPPDASLLGTLIILSEEDSLLLHPEHAEIPFHSFSRVAFSEHTPEIPGSLVYCLNCGHFYARHEMSGHLCR
jgi:hypothetical protein